jgi:hypothetical protein
MPTIQNPAVSSLVQNIKAQRAADSGFQLDANRFDKLLSLVGDGDGGGNVARGLGAGTLLPQEKLALMKANLSSAEMDDLKALLADASLMGALAPDAQNLLKAIAGVEPLAAVDGMGDTQRVDSIGAAQQSPAAAAVAKMKTLIANGQLQSFYDAAIGAVDNPALKAEAMELFNDLPKITSATSAEQMVGLGLWTKAPAGLEAMQKSARYLPGRQVKVTTTVNTDLTEKLDFKPIGMAPIREDAERKYFQALKKDPNGPWRNAQGERFGPDGPERSLLKSDLEKFMSYDPNGTEAVTSRAKLVGEDPANKDNFLVAVDGKDEPISVPKLDIYDLNQPLEMEGDSITVDGKTADYDTPFTKAKVCEAALKMDEHVQKLDFTQAKTMSSGNWLSARFGGGGGKDMVEVQQACVQVIHDTIDMLYHNDNAPGRKGGSDTGRQAIKGAGVCFEQSGVMAGLVVPFHNMLGIDVRPMRGGNYRSVMNTDKPFRSGGHMWLELTFRPSMRTSITDRTWNQSNFEMDKAYSFFGDRYPGGRGSGKLAKVGDTDVNMTGDVSVTTFDRQFGTSGDGRENHISGRGSGVSRVDSGSSDDG